MTGIDFVRHAIADEDNTDMKIIMVTSETGTNRMVEALEAGAHEYIMKPFSSEALFQKLELIGFALT